MTDMQQLQPEQTVLANFLAVSKMRESADISKIAPAIVRAQARMESPARNKSVQVRTQAGPSYTFRYATLDKINDMLRPILAECGLCVQQPVVSTERGLVLLTRLLHESGQWQESEVPLPPPGANWQAFGSAVTYARRNSLTAMLAIAGDEDDDANGATGNHIEASSERAPKIKAAKPASEHHGGTAPAQPAREPTGNATASQAGAINSAGMHWPVLSRDGKAVACRDQAHWIETWKMQLRGLEHGKTDPPAEKLKTLEAKWKVNADTLADIQRRGDQEAVGEVTSAMRALTKKLEEIVAADFPGDRP